MRVRAVGGNSHKVSLLLNLLHKMPRSWLFRNSWSSQTLCNCFMHVSQVSSACIAYSKFSSKLTFEKLWSSQTLYICTKRVLNCAITRYYTFSKVSCIDFLYGNFRSKQTLVQLYNVWIISIMLLQGITLSQKTKSDRLFTQEILWTCSKGMDLYSRYTHI